MTDEQKVREAFNAWHEMPEHDSGPRDAWEAWQAAWQAALSHASATAEEGSVVGGEPVAWKVVDAKGKVFTIYNRRLIESIKAKAIEIGSTIKVTALCEMAPKGWLCMREPNHDGPCAAYSNFAMVHDYTRSREAMDAYRWREFCRQINASDPVSNEASTIRNIIDDAINLGSTCLDMHVDQAIAAKRGET